MRASDGDRDKIISHLRDAHIDGRLSITDFNDRLNAVHDARTYGDLESLIQDIPLVRNREAAPPKPTSIPMTAPLTSSGAPVQPKRNRGNRAMRVAWTIWACVGGINLMIWLLVTLSAGELVYFWPVWVAGPAGALLFTIEMVRRAARE